MKHTLTILLIATAISLGYTQDDNSRVIRIPIVFHIIHSNDSQNISRDSILAEVKNLHDDFLRLNADITKVRDEFKSRIGNPNVDFYLSDSIFNGQREPGVIRVSNNRNHRKLYNKSTVIDPERFLNVYVGDLPGDKDGYTYTPTKIGFRKSDVVHLDYKWIGKRYRLLTHESGHWLGLYHVFEGGCSSDGDDISDTYPQSASTHGDCDLCPPQTADKGCNGGPSNYENFMDYSGCRKMFTEEQAKLIRKTIRECRPKIWNSSKS